MRLQVWCAALLCVLGAEALRPLGLTRTLGSSSTSARCSKSARSRVPVLRTKEELDNMAKWGAILSEADTFDDEYLQKQGRRRTVTPSDVAGAKRGELFIAVGSGLLILAMLAKVAVE